MALIEIDVDDREVLDALGKLAQRAGNLSPALEEIGEDMLASTRRRFATSTGPDGARWAPNSPTTILSYLGSKDRPAGVFGKRDGKLTAKKGAGVAMGKRAPWGDIPAREFRRERAGCARHPGHN
ncbi:MAG: phage virion morphogenesis protein [Thiobacillus sp.]|nr:phage virion morphogenesis protein [Thiobacillus sp.]